MDIKEPDVYHAFKAKELRDSAKADETVRDIMGCPTLVKKSSLAMLLTRMREKIRRPLHV